jgi:hypothetical protein
MRRLVHGLSGRILAAAALCLATEGLLALAARARAPLVFDVGPSTGAYGAGFSDSEERPPSTFRWTREHARLSLPLTTAGGEATLTVRTQGTHRAPTAAHVVLGGVRSGSFPARAGPFREETITVRVPPGPLRLEVLPEGAPDPGVALDWVRIEGLAFHLPLAAWPARALVLGAFLLALAGGFAARGALLAGLWMAAAEALWAARDPFALVHVASRVALPALALAAGGLLLFRKRSGVRWLVLLLLASHVTKGAALFHPSYFYNDVRNNRRFALALVAEDGTLIERARAAQLRFGVAYPRLIAGKKYAFPYSPVFFYPFGLAGPDPHAVDEALKQAVTALAAAQVLLAFWIAGLVFGPGAGVGAAFVAALLPVDLSRLVLALWATTGGHALDTLALGLALLATRRPGERVAFAGFAAASVASLLTYVASLFNVGLFTSALALLFGRRGLRFLAVGVVGAVATVLLLYREFLVTFAVEIVPAVLHGHAAAGPSPDAVESAAGALRRIPIFYGWGLPALALAGFVLVRWRAAPEAARVISAWALAFAALVLLRALPGGLFKDLKEMEFAAPLVALTAGASLEALARGQGHGRWAAALVALGLLAFAVERYVWFVAPWVRLAGL